MTVAGALIIVWPDLLPDSWQSPLLYTHVLETRVRLSRWCEARE